MRKWLWALMTGSALCVWSPWAMASAVSDGGRYQRLDADGDPIGPPVELDDMDGEGERFSILEEDGSCSGRLVRGTTRYYPHYSVVRWSVYRYTADEPPMRECRGFWEEVTTEHGSWMRWWESDEEGHYSGGPLQQVG